MFKWEYVFKQLKKDLIGKDSHRGVSLTYAWLANQFGHFSLGFIPTIFIFNYSKHGFLGINLGTRSPYSYALSVAVFWLVFELFNFLVPILRKQKKHVFKPRWSNLAFDTSTDVLFFALGAFAASCSLEMVLEGYSVASYSKYSFWAVFIILMYPCKYWYSVRIFQQYAYLPFQLRLSEWRNTVNDIDKAVVVDFLNKNSKGNHLLLFGAQKCGKTSLGVGIANELAIRLKKINYTSAFKLGSLIVENNSHLSLDSLWFWRDADVLIVDDINPGFPIEGEIISAKQFLRYVESKVEVTSDIKTLFAEKNIIWIMGNPLFGESKENEWESMLKKLDVASDKIKSVILC